MAAPITTNASAEIVRLEEQIASLQLKLNKPGGVSFLARNTYLTLLRPLEDRLRILKEPSADNPNITPAPAPGPTLSLAADPVFSGARLDTGRVGVDALKLIHYPSV